VRLILKIKFDEATVKTFMKKVASIEKQEKREKPWLA
jgi:hypothetical protein